MWGAGFVSAIEIHDRGSDFEYYDGTNHGHGSLEITDGSNPSVCSIFG